MAIISSYQHKRGSTESFSELNPVLKDGEIAVEQGTPNKIKIGDGVTAWNDLPYFSDNSGILTALEALSRAIEGAEQASNKGKPNGYVGFGETLPKPGNACFVDNTGKLRDSGIPLGLILAGL